MVPLAMYGTEDNDVSSSVPVFQCTMLKAAEQLSGKLMTPYLQKYLDKNQCDPEYEEDATQKALVRKLQKKAIAQLLGTWSR